MSAITVRTPSRVRLRRVIAFLLPERSARRPRLLPTGWVAAGAILLMVASEYSVRRRSQDAALSGSADSAVAVELVAYLLVAAFLLFQLAEPTVSRRLHPLLLLMWGFTLAMLLAAFWSPFPLLATARGMQLVIVASLGHLVARHATAVAMARLGHVFVAVVALSVVVGLVVPFPSLPGAQGRFTWLYVHPNVSGTFLAVGIPLALALLLRRRANGQGAPWPEPAYVLILLVEVGGLLATRSRGSLVAALLGVTAVAFSAARRRSRADVTVIGGSVVVLSWLLAATNLVSFWNRGESAEKVSSLNSRTDVWDQAGQLFAEEPLLGHGFMSARGVFLDTFGLGGAHNAFVEVLVNSGIFGTLWWVALVLFAVRATVGVVSRRHPDGPLIAGVLAAVLGSAMTAGGLGQAATVQNVWLFVVVGWLVAIPGLRWERQGPSVTTPRPATVQLALVKRPTA